VEDQRNVILIVGYQAQNTLGRRLVERVSRVRIYGDEYALRAQVQIINALSAHADHDEMLAYFTAMGPRVAEAFVVHGEPEASSRLAADMRQIGAQEVIIPEIGDTHEL
jgi:metallo-beta-lactamase family protein